MSDNFRSMLIGAVFACGILLGNASYGATCAAPELSVNNDEYNDLVCAGIASIDRRDGVAAVRALEKAAQVTLFEYPNFMLLPRLALAHHQAGHKDRAQTYLDKAELALQLLSRVVRCVETDGPAYFKLVRISGGQTYDVDSPHHEAIADMMCGGMYADIYEEPNLEAVRHDAELIDIYLKAKQEIRSKAK